MKPSDSEDRDITQQDHSTTHHKIIQQQDQTILTPPQQLELEKRPCLVVMAGAAVGQYHALEGKETVLGRAEDADLTLDDVKVSRRHARITLHDNGALLEDMSSTNGTYVNNRQISTSVLVEGDLISIGGSVLKYTYLSSLDAVFHDEVVAAARYDALTRLANRRHFTKRLDEEFERARRYDTPLSLLVCDLDDFKRLNDTHGHAFGDQVLRRVAEALQAGVRRNVDLVGRYGGEEMVVLLPHTDAEAAYTVAEKLRAAVAALGPELETDLPVSVSIGLASLEDEVDDPEALFRCADERLYRAKAGGKNRVER